MAITTDDQRNLQRKQAWQTLLDFLLGLLELEIEPAKSLEQLLQPDSDELDNLSDIGADIGLRMDRVALTPSAAAEASAAHTPMVARLSDGRGWLVLYGFSASRVHVALVQGEVIEESRIKP
ncbi:MAG: hypothetical protein D4R63_07460, partial [Methylococcaceae bacterium]